MPIRWILALGLPRAGASFIGRVFEHASPVRDDCAAGATHADTMGSGPRPAACGDVVYWEGVRACIARAR